MNQQTPIEKQYTMRNKFILVKLFEDKTQLANGIAITETRGKKEIVCGVVRNAEPGLKIPERALCWFPLYAGLPIKLSGESFLVVPSEDIIMIEKVEV